MTGFNHGLTGAAIALIVKNPAAAIPLAFVSHFLTDAIPHWDYGTNRKDGKIGSVRFNKFLSIDFIVAVAVMVILGLLFPAQRWLIWICMALAACPDAAWGYYHYIKKTEKFDWLSRFHLWTEWSETPKGIVVEAIWFLAAWAVIINLR